MDWFNDLEVYEPGKRLLGLPRNWGIIFLSRLRDHAYATHCAVIAPKGVAPLEYRPVAGEARVVLFQNEGTVLDALVVSRANLDTEGRCVVDFDLGRCNLVVEKDGSAHYCGMPIARSDVFHIAL